MKKIGLFSILCMMVLFFSSQALSLVSIDVSGLKNEEYSLGEDIIFEVILLDDEEFLQAEIDIIIKDALSKKTIEKKVSSNEQITIQIEEDFPGGLWSIFASHEDETVERTFLIGENTEVEFEINGDELVIRNKGNVRYTKTIQIKIGSEVSSYTQNIGVGEEKILKLISPEGFYNIEVTDGKTTIKRQNVQLFGTGNVIGAVDRELVGYTGFAGVSEPVDSTDQPVLLDRLPVALVFVAAVMVLGALVFVERKISKKSKK